MPAVSRRAAAAAARARTSLTDVAFAVALLVLVVGELAIDDSRQSPATVAVVAAALVSVAWRRRAPVAVAVAVLGASLLLSATAEGEFPPQLPFLADLLVVYTVAALLAGRRAVAAGALTLALVWTAHLLTGDGDAGDFLPVLIWGAPWAAGRLVRRRTLEAAAAATRAALVEQRREQDLREAAAHERDRIARELHDAVAHGVSLMVVQAGAERLRLDGTADGDPRTREVLAAVEQAGRSALGELRTMLAVLRDAETDSGRRPVPGLDALPELVERVRRAGLPVDAEIAWLAGVPVTVGLSAYRIVQEALTNVLKHSPGARTTVEVAKDGAVLRLRVTNSLPAVPSQPGRTGRGVVGMTERAALLGGRVRAAEDGRAWVVDAELPLTASVPT
ncbi:MAG TPA: histidine kinase [Mycobacteriales bacterium]|nr:histidine kinase [Mycobacteriales bacterium]